MRAAFNVIWSSNVHITLLKLIPRLGYRYVPVKDCPVLAMSTTMN